MIAQVLVELMNKNVDKTFDYLVPSTMQDKIVVGIRVKVPFGNRTLEGFVLSLSNDSNYQKLKSIIEIVDDTIVLNEELLTLGKQLKERTLATLISCYQVMLPKALKAKEGVVVPIRYEKMISLNGSVPKDITFSSKQQQIITLLEKGTCSKKGLQAISSSSVETLLKKGIITEEKVERYRLMEDVVKALRYPLTEEQQKVVHQVLAKRNQFVPFLLHGVTGSGKTEVYMEIIETFLKEGKTSIVLVPEISLTPQIVKRFRARFRSVVAILHSRLSEGEKYDEWRKIARGEVSIVIGARSAIFAPLKNIGIIIIDEEHTASYHQENNPRYSAIDVALIRGERHQCPVLLGSATPTLESFARAERGVYQLLSLPHRVENRPLPKVVVVDLNQTRKKDSFYFSSTLLSKIQDRIEKQEQVMLLLNRRGYASYLSCPHCGYVVKCPNCDISLTYHKNSNTLRCHYCGYGTKLPTTCPQCKESSMRSIGMGTEKLEEELQKLFPSVGIVRMDYDTTSRKGAHEKIIEDFAQGKYQILLGTQMIAKGLDFPKVTLVGVINADTGLNIPDFRSSENTFQLLDQVAGRSGRGTMAGEVVIQTFNPDHYAIQYAKNHDYLGFYQEEMKIRKQLKYSPYYYMTLVKVASKEEVVARMEIQKIYRSLGRNLKSSILLGPTSAGLYKVNNIYYYQIIIKYKKEDALYPTLTKIVDYYKSNSKIKIMIDFNARSFL